MEQTSQKGQEVKTTKMKTYILIDRSGSMSVRWNEVIGAMNTFMDGLKKKAEVFVAAFDSGDIFATAHNGQRKDWNRKRLKDFGPRGLTPLYDAAGQLADLIAEDKPKKAQIIIITDGHENNSRYLTIADVKAIVDGWEKKGYDVIYMGAEFKEVYDSAAAMGVYASKTVNVADSANLSASMTAMSTRNTAYRKGEIAGDDDLDGDIREAAGEGV